MKNMHILLTSMMTICSAAAMEHIDEAAARGKEVVNKIANAVSEATKPAEPTLWEKVKEIMKPSKEALNHSVEFVKEVAKDVTTNKVPAAYQSFVGLSPMKRAAVVAGTVAASYLLVKVAAYVLSSNNTQEDQE